MKKEGGYSEHIEGGFAVRKRPAPPVFPGAASGIASEFLKIRGTAFCPGSFLTGLVIGRIIGAIEGPIIAGSNRRSGQGIYPGVIAFMASGRIDMRKMCTGRYNLEDIDEGMKIMAGKVLISTEYPRLNK